MVKDCKVILNNSAVTVVRFGDIDVQFPSIKMDEKIVRVLFKDGKYTIVANDYQEEPLVVEKDNKREYKKTTIKSNETSHMENTYVIDVE